MAEPTQLVPLTRPEFYKLARRCRDFSAKLATRDHDVVDPEMCAEFNAFLAQVRRYDRLAGPLASLRPARPVTRRAVVGVALVLWLLTLVFGGLVMSSTAWLVALSWSSTAILLVLLIPQSTYGTTVEQIEGRVLAVVEALQEILAGGEMGFTEAAFFQVRDLLQETAADLRLQTLGRSAGWR
ncbi:MAG: hypothetical protein NZ528_11830 [Caldilineales bacterium]|nr:hypothetical protein [Caldilineales bacterium]